MGRYNLYCIVLDAILLILYSFSFQNYHSAVVSSTNMSHQFKVGNISKIHKKIGEIRGVVAYQKYEFLTLVPLHPGIPGVPGGPSFPLIPCKKKRNMSGLFQLK